MSMNIKNEETYQLTKQLSALTGESLTTAVTTAVRERLERVRLQETQDKDDYVERILAIGRECAVHLKEPWLSIDHSDLLYDENGLPR